VSAKVQWTFGDLQGWRLEEANEAIGPLLKKPTVPKALRKCWRSGKVLVAGFTSRTHTFPAVQQLPEKAVVYCTTNRSP